MSIERAVTAFAGIMILLSVALTYWVHPGFIWFTEWDPLFLRRFVKFNFAF